LQPHTLFGYICKKARFCLKLAINCRELRFIPNFGIFNKMQILG
jgi:hypothetical protein